MKRCKFFHRGFLHGPRTCWRITRRFLPARLNNLQASVRVRSVPLRPALRPLPFDPAPSAPFNCRTRRTEQVPPAPKPRPRHPAKHCPNPHHPPGPARPHPSNPPRNRSPFGVTPQTHRHALPPRRPPQLYAPSAAPSSARAVAASSAAQSTYRAFACGFTDHTPSQHTPPGRGASPRSR